FYGILNGFRSSRKIEAATRKHIDFIWLLQGQTIDHTTVSEFRANFRDALKDTFRQVNREGLKRMGDRLSDLVIDGTHLRANSDRQGARTAEWLEKRLAELQLHVEQALREMAEQDVKDEPLSATAEQLEQRLDQLQRERQRCEEALAIARERDEAKQAKDGKSANAVRVPLTDPASYILPNKEGGYAPNYTPVAAVNSATGMIMAADVLADGSEASSVQPLVAEVKQELGKTPERVLADSGFASGANQAAMEKEGIAMYAPVNVSLPETHPARREDPTQPLTQEQIAALPRNASSKKLDRNAFLFDPQNNCYACPMGRILTFHRTVTRDTRDGKISITDYMCSDCTNCPLADGCLSKKATRRTVSRDQYEDVRETTARRMASEEGKAIYRGRAPVIEGTFGTLKGNMGIRAFLLRGLDKARTEWLWICTAFNLKKLLKLHAMPVPQATKGVAAHA
ncbi:MAG: IS1182 family transposase, partial [Gammaproteobacteria bacterium]|nr:IS1182 family transposase [Gammaproteobacteria bacterium]